MAILNEQVNGQDFNGGRQYLVFEKVDGTEDDWYRHGRIHTDEGIAREDVNYKRATYGKYGREFKLMTRGISPWREYEPFNPKAE